jgi:outer membrane lipoprotein SlyB
MIRSASLLAAGLLAVSFVAVPHQAEAKGCIKGAVVGGLAGKVVGHGKAGAAAGCAVGHHNANKNQGNSGQTPAQ